MASRSSSRCARLIGRAVPPEPPRPLRAGRPRNKTATLESSLSWTYRSFYCTVYHEKHATKKRGSYLNSHVLGPWKPSLPASFSLRTTPRRHASQGHDKQNDRRDSPSIETSSTQVSGPRQTATGKLREHLQQTLPRENIYTLPNMLTFSRLLCTPAIGYLILNGQALPATVLFAYAGVTDLLDGWIARRLKLQTVVGTIIDPLADKTLMTVLTVCLAVKGALPIWLATLILGRDVSLAIAAIYYRYASLPEPRTLARYWDFSLPSAEVKPTSISKINTLLQLLLIGSLTALPLVVGAGVTEVAVPIPGAAGGDGEWGWPSRIELDRAVEAARWLVATTTVWSGLSYLYTRNAVVILGQEMSEQRKRAILRRGRGLIGLCFLGCAGVAVGLERAYAAETPRQGRKEGE